MEHDSRPRLAKPQAAGRSRIHGSRDPPPGSPMTDRCERAYVAAAKTATRSGTKTPSAAQAPSASGSAEPDAGVDTAATESNGTTAGKKPAARKAPAKKGPAKKGKATAQGADSGEPDGPGDGEELEDVDLEADL